MSEKAELRLGDQTVELPVIVGSEGEKAIDITRMRGETGYVTYDAGYANTGAVLNGLAMGSSAAIVPPIRTIQS